MKLPKRILELLNRKQSYIESQHGKLENSVIKLQSRLLADILSDLIPELDIKDGIIQETTKNYRLISSLDKTYRNFQIISNQIVLDQVLITTGKLTELNTKYFSSIFSDLPSTFEKIIEKTNKLINLRIGLDEGKLVRGGYLESFFQSNVIGTDLKQMTSKAITSNMNMKDYAKNLREMITGAKEYKGGLEKQFQRYAYDLYQQYDAAYNLMIGNELELNYFIYIGGLVLDSRDFCAAHNNKVWSRDEAKEFMNWTPVQGEYPAGYEIKQKDINVIPSYLGYPGYDFFIDRGGYNCRHSLGWIPDDVAFGMRPDLLNKTS